MYRARSVRVAVIAAAALSLMITGCAQNAEQANKDKGNDKVEVGGQELKADPAPPPPTDAADPAGDGKAKCAEGTTIAYVGTIAGEAAALGKNILAGAKLAVDEHNKANPGCQVTLRESETEGTPDKAPGVVTQLINDEKVLGLVGLAFSGESKAVGPALDKAGLVALSASATNPDLAKNGWRHFFRALGNDDVQGKQVARFIDEQLKSKKVCIVQDDSEYGVGLARHITAALGDKATCSAKVKTKQTEFAAVTGDIASQEPDTVFYSGYYPEAAPFFEQLRGEGYEGNLVAPDGVRDPEFVQNAGDAAEGVYLSCPCLPSTGFEDFYNGYKKLNNAEPGTYSPEAYDAATILLKGIDQGANTRPKLLEFVKNYKGVGLSKPFSFDENGEVEEMPIWIYKVQGGEIVHFMDMSKH